MEEKELEKIELEEKIKKVEKKIEEKVEQILNKAELNYEDYMILKNELSSSKNKLDEKDRKSRKEEYAELMTKMFSNL